MSNGHVDNKVGQANTLRRNSFVSRLPLLESIDPHFAEVWRKHTTTLFGRQQLDLRTRLLILTGQFTMLGYREDLKDMVKTAIAENVDLREVLEVIFQSWIYAGEFRMWSAVKIFVSVVDDAGRLDEVRKSGLTADDVSRGEGQHHQEPSGNGDERDPRFPSLLERYGDGIKTGVAMRPGNHINAITQLDSIDEEFAQLWMDTLFNNMFVRGVLDEKTRLLCILADCLAVQDWYQTPRHMRTALKIGKASPAEVLEVILQSFSLIGHPYLMGLALDDFIKILEGEQMLDSVIDRSKQETLLNVVNARLAKRHSVAELTAEDARGGTHAG